MYFERPYQLKYKGGNLHLLTYAHTVYALSRPEAHLGALWRAGKNVNFWQAL